MLVGPAGTGKTTTMAGVRTMWEAEHGPGTVVGLAPSAMAAQVLATDVGIVTDNTAQWLTQQDQQERRKRRIAVLPRALDRADHPNRIQGLRAALDRLTGEYDRWRLRPGQLLIVDEAGMTDTFTLAHLAQQAGHADARLLLVGDPCQLSAVQTGGAFGLLEPALRPETVRERDDWDDMIVIDAAFAGTTVTVLRAPGGLGPSSYVFMCDSPGGRGAQQAVDVTKIGMIAAATAPPIPPAPASTKTSADRSATI